MVRRKTNQFTLLKDRVCITEALNKDLQERIDSWKRSVEECIELVFLPSPTDLSRMGSIPLLKKTIGDLRDENKVSFGKLQLLEKENAKLWEMLRMLQGDPRITEQPTLMEKAMEKLENGQRLYFPSAFDQGVPSGDWTKIVR